MSYQHIKVLFSLEFYHLAGLKVTKVIWKMTSACGNMTQVVSHKYLSLKVLQVKGSSRWGAHGSLTDMDIKVHSHVHVFTTQVTHTHTLGTQSFVGFLDSQYVKNKCLVSQTENDFSQSNTANLSVSQASSPEQRLGNIIVQTSITSVF